MANYLESTGMAELPAGVTMDDFQTWCTVGPEAAGSTTADLATAMRAGEKMQETDAERAVKLAHTFATRAKRALFPDFPNSGVDDMLEAINSLGTVHKNLVLQQLDLRASQDLHRCPLSLLQDHIRMTVATNAPGPLTIPPPAPGRGVPAAESDLNSTLSTLARTSPTPPGLTALNISACVATHATAALLCQALLHLTSLSHLSLPRLSWRPTHITTAAAELVHAALPRLTALTSLTISNAAKSSFDPCATSATMRTLAAALSAMPALASVHLISSQRCDPSVFAPSGTPGPNLSNPISKRRRISRWIGRAEQLSLDPVIAALSTAPALTALCLSYLSGPRCSQCPCSGISGAFASLQCLQIHFTSTGTTTVGVAAAPSNDILTISPLPSLRSLTVSVCGVLGDEFPVSHALASAAHMPALSTVAILRLPPQPRRNAGIPFHAANMHAPERPELAGELAETPPAPSAQHAQHGQSVSLHATAFETPVGLQGAVEELRHLPRVHALHLAFNIPEDGGFDLHTAAAPAAMQVLQPLSALQQLEELCVTTAEGACARLARNAWAVLWSAPHAVLCALTALRFDVETQPAQACELREHLPRLTGLRVLSVRGLRCGDVTDLHACFAPLTQLTELEVSVAPVDGAVVRCFAECARLMPQLRAGRLRSCEGLQLEGGEAPGGAGAPACAAYATWVEGLLLLPAHGLFEFDMVCPGVTEQAYTAVREQLQSQGGTVSPDCRKIEFHN